MWLDPARRASGSRLNNPADWSPSLDWAFELARTLPTGIKLGPGLDRDLLPDGRRSDGSSTPIEAQWVSIDGDVVELAVWSKLYRMRLNALMNAMNPPVDIAASR